MFDDPNNNTSNKEENKGITNAPLTPVGGPPIITTGTRAKRRRRTKRIIFWSLLGLLLVGGAVAALYFLPNGPRLKNGDITIGDTVITQQQISDYTANVDAYLKQNPDASFEENPEDTKRTPKEIATDDIIMNAVLKKYAKQYGITVTNTAVAQAAKLDPKSEEEANVLLNGEVGEEGSMNRTRIENIAYKDALEDKLIASKDVFKMSASFISVYFQELPEGEVAAEYAKAKDRLTKEALPLFQQKQSKEEIAKVANVNTLDTDTSDDEDHLQYEQGIVTTASMNEKLRGDEFQDTVPTEDYPYVRISTEKPESLNEKIKNLQNVGDYTEVFMEQTGAYSIIRLESKSGGKYSSWDALLKENKETYAYASPSPLVTALRPLSNQVVASINTAFNIATNTEDAGAVSRPASCTIGGHNLCYWVASINTTNDTLIGGTSFYFHNRSGCRGCTGSGNFTTSSGGYLRLQYNCNGRAAIFTNSSDPNQNNAHQGPSSHPSGYDYLGASFPAWIPSEMNARGNAHVEYYYKKDWVASANAPGTKVRADDGTYTTSTIDVEPNQNVQFQHAVKITEGTSTAAIRGSTTNTVNGKVASNPPLNGLSNTLFLNSGATVNTVAAKETSKTLITQAYVSDTNIYCQNLTATPGGGGSANRVSNPACIRVPFKYGLTPGVTNENKTIEKGTELATVRGDIKNSGPTKSRDNTIWQMSMIVVAPVPAAIPTGGNSTNAACGVAQNGQDGRYVGNYFGSSPTCKSVARGSGSIESTGLSVSAQNVVIEGDNIQLGSRVCFALSVRDRAQDKAEWAHSDLVCMVVGKKPKVQVWGSDLSVGRMFINGTTSSSSVNGSITVLTEPDPETPPYSSSMISGLWPTGVDNSGNKLAPGASDPHWQLANVYKASENGKALTPKSGDAHWNSNNTAATCQPGPYPRAASVINTNAVDVGFNEAWKASLPNSSWIGAYTDANNLNNDGSCAYPAMGSTISQTIFEKGPIWVFRLTNGFTIDSCVDPNTVRLNLNLAADDEVQILVNGKTIAEPGDFRHYGNWPSTPVSFTTPTSTAFKNGANSLEIRVKSAYQYTGLLLNSITVAAASCYPVVPGNVFGSWAEYGIFAPGTIQNMGSGSAFAAKSIGSTAKCSYSTLSFSNTAKGQQACTDTSIGGYTNSDVIPNIASYFPLKTTTPTIAGNGLSDQNVKGVYKAPNTLDLSGGNIQKGRWVVINAPNSTITITGDINYENGGLSSVNDIPQVVIIAKNIRIAGNVRNVDAWLVAIADANGGGVVNTCSDVALTANLTINDCVNDLKINGPVMSNKLYLRRTAGANSPAEAGTPAEIINMRPDAYLWGVARASTSGRLETVYSRELPPRF